MKSWYQLYARVLAANHFCKMEEQLVSAQAVSLASVYVVRALNCLPGLGDPGPHVYPMDAVAVWLALGIPARGSRIAAPQRHGIERPSADLTWPEPRAYRRSGRAYRRHRGARRIGRSHHGKRIYLIRRIENVVELSAAVHRRIGYIPSRRAQADLEARKYASPAFVPLSLYRRSCSK
jgi:hypothetical protein